MTEKRNPIDELFRNKLGNYEMESPDALWSNIAQKRSAGSVAWYKGSMLIMSTVLVLAVCAGAYWWNAPADTLAAQPVENAPIVAADAGNGSVGKATAQANPVNFNAVVTPQPKIYENAPLAEKTSASVAAGNYKTPARSNNGTGTPAKPTQKTSVVSADLPSRVVMAEADLNKYVAEFTERLSQTSGKKFTNGTNITKPANTVFAKKEDKVEEPEKVNDKAKLDEAKSIAKAEDAAKKMKKGMWSVDVYSKTVQNFASIKGNNQFQAHIDARKKSESYLVSFGAGARLNYTWINSNITLGAGVTYTSVREKMDFVNVVTTTTTTPRTYTYYNLDPTTQLPVGPPMTRTVNETTTSSVNNSKANVNNISMIDVPVTLEIPMCTKLTENSRFGFAAQPGLVANVYMKKSGLQIANDGQTANETSPYMLKSGLSMRIGFSATMNVCKASNCQLFLQPAYTQSLTNASKNPVNYKLNAISLDFGLRYTLK